MLHCWVALLSFRYNVLKGRYWVQDTYLKKGRKSHSIKPYSKKTWFKSVRRYYVFVKLRLKLLQEKKTCQITKKNKGPVIIFWLG